MTVGRSKSRSFLTLIFIVKSVSKNLLIRIFIIKAKLSARVLHHKEEKIYIYNICYTSGKNLPWFKFIYLLPGNGKEW